MKIKIVTLALALGALSLAGCKPLTPAQKTTLQIAGKDALIVTQSTVGGAITAALASGQVTPQGIGIAAGIGAIEGGIQGFRSLQGTAKAASPVAIPSTFAAYSGSPTVAKLVAPALAQATAKLTSLGVPASTANETVADAADAALAGNK